MHNRAKRKLNIILLIIDFFIQAGILFLLRQFCRRRRITSE